MSEYEIGKDIRDLQTQIADLQQAYRDLVARYEDGNKTDEPTKQR